MARKTYTGTFNLNTLTPAIEAQVRSAIVFKRAGTVAAATTIEVDAPDITVIDPIVAAHDPAIKSTEQNDFDSAVVKLKALGLTDAELTAVGVVRATRVR